MLNKTAEIISNLVVASGVYKMTLSSRELAHDSQPGQFLHIRVNPGNDPLLRRPISVHAVEDEDKISLLYGTIGRGTRLLSKKKSGEEIDVLGPLGHGFDLSEKPDRAVLVAGGMGAAPLFFVAQRLKGLVKESKLLIGAKTKEGLLSVSDFKEIGCDVWQTTEDGSAGRRGYITDLFEQALLDQTIGGSIRVYACGPKEMMARTATIAGIYNVPCEVSLEEKMACGLGACLSCVVDTIDGLKRVCKEGPVFRSDEIKW
jgi:dihydroorotate dehydrogenase electron transfer subunit